jgi:hypothetical protein
VWRLGEGRGVRRGDEVAPQRRVSAEHATAFPETPHMWDRWGGLGGLAPPSSARPPDRGRVLISAGRIVRGRGAQGSDGASAFGLPTTLRVIGAPISNAFPWLRHATKGMPVGETSIRAEPGCLKYFSRSLNRFPHNPKRYSMVELPSKHSPGP